VPHISKRLAAIVAQLAKASLANLLDLASAGIANPL